MDSVNVSILCHAVDVLSDSKYSHESPAHHKPQVSCHPAYSWVTTVTETPGSYMELTLPLGHLRSPVGGHAVWCPKCQILSPIMVFLI